MSFVSIEPRVWVGAGVSAVALLAIWAKPLWAFVRSKFEAEDGDELEDDYEDLRALRRLEMRQDTLGSAEFGQGLELLKRSFFG